MEFTPQILDLSSQLQEAVRITYNPTSSQEQRLQAYQMLEAVKEDVEKAVMCGFCLARKECDSNCRHLGLQLLENTIKYKWVSLPLEIKVVIKNGVMNLMLEGTLDILSEQLYIKDKLSRLVVEMIKREWPQQWPTLLTELNELVLKGPTQTELVLFVFLRFCEDVVILQNLESSIRRKELHLAISSEMKDVFSFFLTCLCNFHSTYLQGTTQAECVQVLQTLLKTISTYCEWIQLEHIFMEDNKLLKNLCQMLGDDNFKMDANDCLLQIVPRKETKTDFKSSILYLFQATGMTAIYNAAVKSSVPAVSEVEFFFLKSLTQLITSLGSQLFVLWDENPRLETEACFAEYLNALLCFSRHPSLSIYKYTIATWSQFLKHKKISKNEKLIQVLPQLLDIISRKMVKHGYPYKNCDVSSQYSRIEFDKDEEYSMFFYKTRGETIVVVKYIASISPEVIYRFAVEWFSTVLKQPINTGTDQSSCNLLSPSYLEWDAMSFFLVTVISRVRSINENIATAEEGKALIQQCLAFKTTDPLILSSLLTCISGLFVFLKDIPEALSEILNIIFSALTFNVEGQTKRTRSRLVKNVRKHAASMLVSLACTNSQILLPAFDHLNEVFNKVSAGDISQMEKCTILEALLVLNNKFCDYNKQRLYIEMVTSPVKEQWLVLKEPFSCPLKYMSFIGLDKPPEKPSEFDVCGQNRSLIQDCLNTIIALIKRSELDNDSDKLRKGGFYEDDGIQSRNPATSQLLSFYHNIFCFIKVSLELWNPNCIQVLSEGYTKAYHLPELERINLMGFSAPSPDDPYLEFQKVTEPLERMQHFLMASHDTWCQILGQSGRCMGLQFYNLPHLVQYILHSVFVNLPHVADWRLRSIIKGFFKNFLLNAPPECDQTVILPLVNHLCPLMLEKLSERWQYVTEQIINGAHDDDGNNDEQEALEEVMIRHTTREYIDVIKLLLIESTNTSNDDNMEGEENGQAINTNANNSNNISTRGQLLLQCDSICQTIFTTLLKALWWDDTTACIKSINLLEVCMKWLVKCGSQHLSEAAVDFMLMSVFHGLKVHGQHDSNLTALLSLGLHIYEIMLPKFPNIKWVLCKLPGVTEKLVDGFDAFLQNIPNSKIKPSKLNKQKKEAFRDVVNGVIGKSRSEDLKLPVQIVDLPPIFKKTRPKQPSIMEELDACDTALLFS